LSFGLNAILGSSVPQLSELSLGPNTSDDVVIFEKDPFLRSSEKVKILALS
jgi:hypothetical protein